VSSSTPALRRTPRVLALALAAGLAVLAMDLGSKAWVLNNLSREVHAPPPVCSVDAMGFVTRQRARMPARVLVDGFFELRYAENCGAAFGFLRNAPAFLKKGVFYLAATAAILVLSWMLFQGRGGKAFAASVPLIAAGAAGNLVDRVRYGYVVDFLRFFGETPAWMVEAFHAPPAWEYPTFNVADIAITVGVVLLLIDGFQEARLEKRQQLARESASAST